jgi:hypothetical protein
MHWCGDVAENLNVALSLVEDKSLELTDLVGELTSCSDSLQSMGEELQKATAKNADKHTGDDAMNLKKTAGVYGAAIRDAEKNLGFGEANVVSARTLAGGDTTSPDAAAEADKVLGELDLAEVKVSDSVDALAEMVGACTAGASSTVGDRAATEYFNVNKWVAAGFEENSSTCGGEEIGAPSARSKEECAAYCDATVAPKKCIAFQSYDDGACVLFSSVEATSYYSEADCADAGKAVCSLKMSESTGFSPKDGTKKEARCFY